MGSSGFVAKRINIKRCAVKKNRLVALSDEGAQAKRFVRIEDLDWSEETVLIAWLKDAPFPVHLIRRVYENKDGSTGTLYLASSGATLL